MAMNIIGLFDKFGDARAAVVALQKAGYRADDMSLVASSRYADAEATGDGSAGWGQSLTDLLLDVRRMTLPGVGPALVAGSLSNKLDPPSASLSLQASSANLLQTLVGVGVPAEDANVYAEGVRRGGSLLCVLVDSSDAARQVADLMEPHDAVDIDLRMEQYQQEGWTHFDEYADPAPGLPATAVISDGTTAQAQPGLRAMTAGASDVSRPLPPARAAHIAERDQVVIPVVEEQLRVDTREVTRRGIRVYVQVEEIPITRQVALRDETILIERQPVNRIASDTELAAIQEAVFEVYERDQEAVVDKQPVVVEEIVIKKEVEERIEMVEATIRHTNVEIEEVPGPPPDAAEQVG